MQTMFCTIVFEMEKVSCFSQLSEVSSRILGVVSKTMEFSRKQGYCNIAIEIEKSACFFK